MLKESISTHGTIDPSHRTLFFPPLLSTRSNAQASLSYACSAPYSAIGLPRLVFLLVPISTILLLPPLKWRLRHFMPSRPPTTLDSTRFHCRQLVQILVTLPRHQKRRNDPTEERSPQNTYGVHPMHSSSFAREKSSLCLLVNTSEPSLPEPTLNP